MFGSEGIYSRHTQVRIHRGFKRNICIIIVVCFTVIVPFTAGMQALLLLLQFVFSMPSNFAVSTS
jgi:hypothetical protein